VDDDEEDEDIRYSDYASPLIAQAAKKEVNIS
jgi:hypothetical protein